MAFESNSVVEEENKGEKIYEILGLRVKSMLGVDGKKGYRLGRGRQRKRKLQF